jgi:NADPH:quinone reductase-like Zn-dependent oxidoreductase
LVAEVMRITNGNGARVAFDPAGGPDFPKLISALANQGIVYIYGVLSEGDTPILVLEMIRKMPTVKGYSIRLVVGDEAHRKVAVEYVAKGLASGALKPLIDRTSSTIWRMHTAIWRTAANLVRSSLPFELMSIRG